MIMSGRGPSASSGQAALGPDDLALGLDAVVLDHLGPALGLELELVEIGLGRAAGGEVAELGKFLLHLGVLDDLEAKPVQPIENRSRHAGRSDQAEKHG